MPQIKRSGDFFAHSQYLTVGICYDPENPQHPPHKPAYRRDDGRKQRDDDADDGGGACGSLFGIGDRIGFWQNFGKYQHQYRHNQSGQCNAAFPQHAGKQGRGKRGGQNINQIISKQD